MIDRSRQVSNALGLVGAAAGGLAGSFAFDWFIRHRFYAMVVPGALLGLGCGLLARHCSTTRGLVGPAAGVLLGLRLEWTYWPMRDDPRFAYMLTHACELEPVTLPTVGPGGFFAYWFGKDGDLGGRLRANPGGF